MIFYTEQINNDVYSCSVNLNTGLIAPATCSIQQSNSSINNAADAIVIQGFASN